MFTPFLDGIKEHLWSFSKAPDARFMLTAGSIPIHIAGGIAFYPALRRTVGPVPELQKHQAQNSCLCRYRCSNYRRAKTSE